MYRKKCHRLFQQDILCVRKSPIHGLGLFACKPIPELSIISKPIAMDETELYAIISHHEHYLNPDLTHVWELVETQLDSTYSIFNAEDLYESLRPATRNETNFEMSKCINHSCDANCGHLNTFDVVTIRSIESSEELTLDYSSIWSESKDITMYPTCNCGSSSCRKRISFSDWKLEEIQLRYWPFIAPYLRSRILTLHMLTQNWLMLNRLREVQIKRGFPDAI